MITGVADVGQLDRRQCWDAAGRRVSHTWMAANCDRFCCAILDRPASSHPPVAYGDRIPFGQRQTGVPRPGLRGAAVTLVEGSTFCITQTSGDLLPGEPQGLFVHDTRVLSRWSMTSNGGPSGPLAVQQADPDAAALIGCPPLTQDAPADAGFADLFEAKPGGIQLAAAVSVAANDSVLKSTACRSERTHGLLIRGDSNPEAVGHAAEHARAASCVPRGNVGPGGAAKTPPGHARPWGVS